MPQLRFRMAMSADTPDIVALMNETFRTPIDPSTWEWYANRNPNGPSRVYLALESERDTLVGAIGFSPIRLRVDGTSVMADYAHHLALKPAYRDTLSYLSLLRHSFKGQADGPTKFAIGPPNRTAYPIHKTLMKWVDFGFLDCLRKLSPQGRQNSCRELKAFPASFDSLYASISKDLSFSVEKTAEWANWRFCGRPGSPYSVYAAGPDDQLRGYVVLKRWQEPDGYRKAHIIDLHALDEGALASLITAAESYAGDCEELNLWAVQGYPYRSSLESMGFAASFRQPLIVRTYDSSPLSYPTGKGSLSYGDGDSLY